MASAVGKRRRRGVEKERDHDRKPDRKPDPHGHPNSVATCAFLAIRPVLARRRRHDPAPVSVRRRDTRQRRHAAAEGTRHLACVLVCRGRRDRGRPCLRPGRARPAAGRCRVCLVQHQPRVAVDRPGRPHRRRCRQRRLPDRLGHAASIPLHRLPHDHSVRRERGAARQVSRRRGPATVRSAGDCVRHGRPGAAGASACHVAHGAPLCRPRAPRGGTRSGRATAGEPRPGRPGRVGLYVGDDGPSQGRDDFARQRDGRRSHVGSFFTNHATARTRGLPAAVSRVGAHFRRVLRAVGRADDELRRRPRDHLRQHSGDSARRVHGGAPHLGKALLERDHFDARGDLAGAMGLPPRTGSGQASRAMP